MQHQDGHSQLVATTIPNCRAYDPCFNYELAVIIQDGLRRMCKEQESVFYYITVHERELRAPGDARGGGRRHLARHVSARRRAARAKCACSSSAPARFCARCSRLRRCSRRRFGIPADVWSVTSFSELRRDALDVERWNARHPRRAARELSCASVLRGRCSGPFVAATDYMKTRPGPDSPVGSRPLRRARHGRLRAQRRPRSAAGPSSRSIANRSPSPR